MNERIQKFLVVCGMPNEQIMEILEDRKQTRYMQNFAELIIKECMSLCDETQANYLKRSEATMDFDEKNIFAEGEAVSGIIKYKMKKHFGVE